MESWHQNPEFRNNPEDVHPCYCSYYLRGMRTIWTGSHLNSNGQLVYQDCLNSTTPISSTTTNSEACVGASIKVDPSESFVYTSEICSNNYVFICQRTIGNLS